MGSALIPVVRPKSDTAVSMSHKYVSHATMIARKGGFG
jgi:hypothetical protein